MLLLTSFFSLIFFSAQRKNEQQFFDTDRRLGRRCQRWQFRCERGRTSSRSSISWRQMCSRSQDVHQIPHLIVISLIWPETGLFLFWFCLHHSHFPFCREEIKKLAGKMFHMSRNRSVLSFTLFWTFLLGSIYCSSVGVLMPLPSVGDVPQPALKEETKPKIRHCSPYATKRETDV